MIMNQPPQDDGKKLPSNNPRSSEKRSDEAYWNALLEQGEYSGPGEYSAADSWNEPGTVYNNVEAGPRHIINEQDWTLAHNSFDRDQSISLEVIGYNRGGLLVGWNSLRGFVPASQLVGFPVDVDDNTRKHLLNKRISDTLNLRIIELDSEANRLILSERAAQTEPGQRADVLQQLETGEIREGLVTNLCDFGAFVDLGGVEGLIHISELSWGRVGHPRDVLSSGQTVRVYVMSVDSEDERIALSLKRLQPDPWETVAARYRPGQQVEGVITNVVDFGAFACIEEGLEGLVHISELAEGQFLHPRNVVKEGDKVLARIINIDGPSRRLGLSLRKLNSFENNLFSTNGSGNGNGASSANSDGINYLNNGRLGD
jgi:small subunit ribosomal protein S1